jgi:hypothetical protein
MSTPWLEDFRDIVAAGKIIELGHIMNEDMPYSPNHPPFMFRLTKLHEESRLAGSDTSASSDMFTMGSHNGTHIDALNHIACCGVVYPERRAEDVATRRDGYREHGIETVPPIFCRGVLLDVTLLHGGKSLPPGYGISSEELAETARREKIEIRAGDAVLIRSAGNNFGATTANMSACSMAGPARCGKPPSGSAIRAFASPAPTHSPMTAGRRTCLPMWS